MNLSALFIRRPVATTLLTVALGLAGILAYVKLPVSPLPQVDFPTISVFAQMPGASPETMAATVAAPLERHLGAIADVTEMTSLSGVGTTRITLQFGLNRDSDGAARDVQAAIAAARADLPAALRSNPTYRKFNPSDAPILVIALTSKTLTAGQLYDTAATVLQQKLSQIDGVGNVDVAGSSLPAVRVELQPYPLFKYGIGLEDVRAALTSANAHSPKGAIEEGSTHYQIYTNDQAQHAADYQDLVIAYRKGAAVRLRDVAEVNDSVEDLRNQGLLNGLPAVMLILYRQPGANIVETVDRVREALPQLEQDLPGGIDVTVAHDKSVTIRASLRNTQRTLIIAVCLVVGVVFLFLRNARAALIPSVTVPLSIIGTFAVMYLLNYSLDNLSLMALTISAGFVVDDAIVVLENVARHIEGGMPRMQATLLGAREVGFTVCSMSFSLIAVFLPILLMGGIVGRIFQEFAITLSLSILISLALSLTTTPMMCAQLLRQEIPNGRTGWLPRASGRMFTAMHDFYDRTLSWALRHPRLIMLALAGTVVLNVWLFIVVPKGFFPEQDTGLLVGGVQADQSISFQLMKQKMSQLQRIVKDDPAVATVAGFTGGQSRNGGFVFIRLKPLRERPPMGVVMGRLRRNLAQVPGARLFLNPVQDIRAGGRQSLAMYQYTLTSEDTDELYSWVPRLTEALQKMPELTDVNSDQQQNGLQARVVIDRAATARLGLTPQSVDNTLYDAFGQRQVSTIYNPLNQYHVVMEVAPEYWQDPSILKQIRVSTSGAFASGTQLSGFAARNYSSPKGTAAASPASNSAANQANNAIGTSGRTSVSAGTAVSTSGETMVPLDAVASFEPSKTPLNVNHQGPFVASTISFNLDPHASLGQARGLIERKMQEIGMPASIRGTFAGTANVFQASLRNEPLLLLAAIVAVYIVLGILYESYIHPITILSTLPSAGVGAVLSLLLFGSQFSIMALIGVILLIGIVKKNAIMMIDFALQAERAERLSPLESIYRACLLRFRPIMMTTFAALLGALPLAFDHGDGAELRAPLGISIVGGLIVSQVLTLYTTPIVYLYLDRFRNWGELRWTALFRRKPVVIPESAD